MLISVLLKNCSSLEAKVKYKRMYLNLFDLDYVGKKGLIFCSLYYTQLGKLGTFWGLLLQLCVKFLRVLIINLGPIQSLKCRNIVPGCSSGKGRRRLWCDGHIIFITGGLLLTLQLISYFSFVPVLQDISSAYGEYLIQKQLYEHAALILARAGIFEKALDAFLSCGSWQQALCMASRLGYTKERLSSLARTMAGRR